MDILTVIRFYWRCFQTGAIYILLVMTMRYRYFAWRLVTSSHHYRKSNILGIRCYYSTPYMAFLIREALNNIPALLSSRRYPSFV